MAKRRRFLTEANLHDDSGETPYIGPLRLKNDKASCHSQASNNGALSNPSGMQPSAGARRFRNTHLYIIDGSYPAS